MGGNFGGMLQRAQEVWNETHNQSPYPIFINRLYAKTHVQAQSQKMGSPLPQPHLLQNLHRPRRAHRLPNRSALDSVEECSVCIPHGQPSVNC